MEAVRAFSLLFVCSEALVHTYVYVCVQAIDASLWPRPLAISRLNGFWRKFMHRLSERVSACVSAFECTLPIMRTI